MELLVFILVRHLPQLNMRVKESPSHVPLRPQRLPVESARLVANTVYILAELPSLCSPAGEAWETHTAKYPVNTKTQYAYKRMTDVHLICTITVHPDTVAVFIFLRTISLPMLHSLDLHIIMISIMTVKLINKPDFVMVALCFSKRVNLPSTNNGYMCEIRCKCKYY